MASPVPFCTDQVTAGFVALAGNTWADNCNVPLSVVMVVAPPAELTTMELTGITWLDIVTVKDPDTPDPSVAEAVTVTVPFDTAVTSPL